MINIILFIDGSRPLNKDRGSVLPVYGSHSDQGEDAKR